MKASASWDTRRRKELVSNNETVRHFNVHSFPCCSITSPFFCILYLIDIIYQEVDDESLADFFILDLITECSRLN